MPGPRRQRYEHPTTALHVSINVRQRRTLIVHPAALTPLRTVKQVADFHRTLLLGGVAMNPRSHLRLVYEANPLAFLAEQSGGRARRSPSLAVTCSRFHCWAPAFAFNGTSDAPVLHGLELVPATVAHLAFDLSLLMYVRRARTACGGFWT